MAQINEDIPRHKMQSMQIDSISYIEKLSFNEGTELKHCMPYEKVTKNIEDIGNRVIDVNKERTNTLESISKNLLRK